MLGYRSTFAIDLEHTTTTDREHAVDDVLKEGFNWLRTQKRLDAVDSLEPGVTRAFSNGSEVTYIRGRTDAGTEYAKLIALDPPITNAADPKQSSGSVRKDSTGASNATLRRRADSTAHSSGRGERWATTLLAGVDLHDPQARPQVVVEVDAPHDPGRFGIGATFTARPVLATNILGAFACDDHGFKVSDGPRLLFPEDLDDLVVQLAETDHHGLVFLSGTDGTVAANTWKKSLAKVTHETVGQAAVFVLSPEATAAFNARVSASHAIPLFGLRIFRPGAVLDDPEDGRRHRVVSATSLIVDSRVEDLRRGFGRLCREHANSVPLDRFLRRLDVVTAMRLDEITGISGTTSEKVRTEPFPPAQGPSDPTAPSEGTPAAQDSSFTGVTAPSGAPDSPVLGTPPVNPPTEPEDGSDARPGHDSSESGIPELVGDPVDGGSALVTLERQNSTLRAELDQALAEHRELRSRLADTASEADRRIRAAERTAVLRAEEHQRENTALQKELDDLLMDNTLLSDEVHDSQDDLRATRYQLVRARRRLTTAGIDPSDSFETPPRNTHDNPPDSWEDLQSLSSGAFPHLRFGDDCWRGASELAPKDPLGQWVRMTWDVLVTLDEFAFHRTSDDERFDGGLLDYLGGAAPAGAHLIPKGRFRPSESETVKGRRDWMQERRFRVPTDVNPSGIEEMLAHVAIQTRGSVSPRLYLDDRTADLGVVVVGYIGPHLTNTKTS